MNVDFDLSLPSRISFGAGRAADLPAAVAALGDRVLVVTGSDPGRYRELIQGLSGMVQAVEAFSLVGEPSVADARSAARVGQGVGAEVIVGIGGGSVIDLAKAAAVLVANGGDPLDYMEVVGRGQPITVAPLPVVAVPTTSGTGAEVTANAVLSAPEQGVKASLRHPMMIPTRAIIDPLLAVGCSPAVTASAGMDALTQCLEPYISIKANPVTDAWARAGLAHGGRSIVAAFKDGRDVSARTDMALCALMGGLSLANAKLGVVHGFAGVLGGMSEAPHGSLCAALLAPACAMNLRRGGSLVGARFAEIAVALTGDHSATAEDAIDWIERTCHALEVPALGAYGFRRDQVDEVVAKVARASSTAGNPIVLPTEDLSEIFLNAFSPTSRG